MNLRKLFLGALLTVSFGNQAFANCQASYMEKIESYILPGSVQFGAYVLSFSAINYVNAAEVLADGQNRERSCGPNCLEIGGTEVHPNMIEDLKKRMRAAGLGEQEMEARVLQYFQIFDAKELLVQNLVEFLVDKGFKIEKAAPGYHSFGLNPQRSPMNHGVGQRVIVHDETGFIGLITFSNQFRQDINIFPDGKSTNQIIKLPH